MTPRTERSFPARTARNFVLDWRRWGLGVSTALENGGFTIRFWVGPLRFGIAYDRKRFTDA